MAPVGWIGGEGAWYTPPDPPRWCDECEADLEWVDHEPACPYRPCPGCDVVGPHPADSECDAPRVEAAV